LPLLLLLLLLLRQHDCHLCAACACMLKIHQLLPLLFLGLRLQLPVLLIRRLHVPRQLLSMLLAASMHLRALHVTRAKLLLQDRQPCGSYCCCRSCGRVC
jgi:hypothetical protein